MAAQPVVVGGTYDWFLDPASINTEAAPDVFGAWDITNAIVTITFAPFGDGPNAPPTLPAQHFTATVVSGPAGTAHYINGPTLFSVAGVWGMSWRVSLSGTVLESEILFFNVRPSGAAL